MNPRRESGDWPKWRNRVLDWIARKSVDEPYIDNLFGRICRLVREDGVPLDRATLHLRTLHPQLFGGTLEWRPGMRDAEVHFHERSVVRDASFLNSPVRALFEGADGIRQRLDILAEGSDPGYAIFLDLRRQGFTDYLALPMRFTDGKRHASSWATRRSSGFTVDDIVLIEEILPALAMAVEIRLNRRIAKNLLNTYVGPRAGERIFRGEITRGSGETIRAAIWNSDLRGFTRLSQNWPRDRLIDLLNGYFDVMGEAVQSQGGEILKFIGDGLLAIFPLDAPDACGRSLHAARHARAGMARFNAERQARGEITVGFGLSLHVGDVMWGNIGTASRLDFTVIGPAVNLTERLQELAKQLGRDILLSHEFTRDCAGLEDQLESLGVHRLRDIEEPIEVYALTQPSRSSATSS